MKTFKADDELADVFIRHGFIETTSRINKIKGRKSFKTSKNASKEIYFNYINIQILDSTYLMDSCYEMTENDLKYLLLYFKLNSSDRNELTNSGNFQFKRYGERLASMIKELNNLNKVDRQGPRRNKLERLIETYNSIII